MGFGDYPAEYNPKVHGPYDPARFYGKPDTPFSQVKLGEVKCYELIKIILYIFFKSLGSAIKIVLLILLFSIV